MPEDLSNSVGKCLTIPWKGRTYVINGFGFKDRQTLYSELMRIKRRRVTQPVADLFDILPYNEWQKQMDRARDAAGDIEDINDAEAQKFLSSEEGIATFLFSLLDRRHPGEFNREEMSEMLIRKVVSEQDLADVMTAISEALGIRKKEEGKPETMATTPPGSLPPTMQEATTG